MQEQHLSARYVVALATICAAASGATAAAVAWICLPGRGLSSPLQSSDGAQSLYKIWPDWWKGFWNSRSSRATKEEAVQRRDREVVIASDAEGDDYCTPKQLGSALAWKGVDRGIPETYSPVKKTDPRDPRKREGYLSWDDYFMSIAFLSAQRSKDPNRQVGACIVSQERIILGIGYNGFPRGCDDDELPWAKVSNDGDPLKTKYPYVCHAEVNAILNRNQALSSKQRLYVTMFPCNECAKLIIQAGIEEVVYFTDKGGGDRGLDPSGAKPDIAYAASKRLLHLAGVKFWQHCPQKQSIALVFR